MIVLIFLFILSLSNIIYYVCFLNLKPYNNVLNYFRGMPTNENPAIVGFMVKGNTNVNDIIATLLDLKMRGYLNINCEIINGKEKIVLSLTDKDKLLILKDYENFLLDSIFKDNNIIVFDDILSSNQFKMIVKIFGEMIKKRVDIKSTHKISNKRNLSKINFLTNYIVLGFSIFYTLLIPLFVAKINLSIALAVSFILSMLFFLFYRRIIINSNLQLDKYILYFSYISGTIELCLLILLYCINPNVNFNINGILNIINLIISALVTIMFIYPALTNKNSQILDYVFYAFCIMSIFFGNIIGLCLVTLYFSARIYFDSPKHVNLREDNEREKWLALKRFLNDFSIIRERDIKEIEIWGKYLIYAIAMGVNKKCFSHYEKLLNIKLINKNILETYYTENIMY